jgi:oligosaccharide repeat unit polymerase
MSAMAPPHRSASAVRTLQQWFPALPLLIYWIGTLILYEYGPVINPALRPQTYAYILGGLACFALSYALGIGRRRPGSPRFQQREVAFAELWLRWTAPAALFGAGGLVVDRLLSGAGSLSRTLSETEYVREEFVANTTWLTTISVAPYTLSLVAIAAYFVCLKHRRVSRSLHLMILAQMALLAYNAILSVNRGVLLWLLTYWIFYLFFVEGMSVRGFLFSRNYRATRAAFVLFVIASVGYMYFIARYRNSEMYLRYLASTEVIDERYGLAGIDAPAAGALISLVGYGTHEFIFIDAFLERAEPLAFYPGFLVGSRVLDQIRRIDPAFETQAEITGRLWINDAGLPPFAWPSVFGWLLTMFGSVGAAVFLALLGFVYGRLVRTYIVTHTFGAMVLVFCLYTSLNMSYNWIGGDLPQNVGYLVGAALLAWRQRVPV